MGLMGGGYREFIALPSWTCTGPETGSSRNESRDGRTSLGFGAFRFRQLPLPLPVQFALIFLPQRGEAGPIIAANEEQQERDRQKIVGFDGEYHHPQEKRTDADFGVRQPAAAAAVLDLFNAHLAVSADRVFGRARESGLIADERLKDRPRVDDGQRDAGGHQRRKK